MGWLAAGRSRCPQAFEWARLQEWIVSAYTLVVGMEWVASEHNVHADSLSRWNSPAARVAYHRSTTTPPAPLPPTFRKAKRATIKFFNETDR
jgi:hypothetical protein